MSHVLNRTETLTARKRHGCVVCLRWIAPGERYVRWTGIDRNTYEFGTSAYCVGCDLAWRFDQRFNDHYDDVCYDISECLSEMDDGIMASALHEGFCAQWWSRPELAVVS